MQTRPYKLLGSGELAWLTRSAQQSLDNWAGEWLAGTGSTAVRCLPAHECSNKNRLAGQPAAWTRFSMPQGHWFAILLDDHAAAVLAGGLFGPAGAGGRAPGDRQSALALSVVRKAAAHMSLSLLKRMVPLGDAALPAISSDSLPAPVWQYGSGAVVFEISLASEQVWALAAPETVIAACDGRGRRPGKPELTDLAQALQRQKVELQVSSGEAEMELGTLQTLAVGDVVRLDTRADEPLAVTDALGAQMGRAFLGVNEGSKAIQLVIS
jgi:flagellar motor switch/type III secretory pathway protein FliN